MRRPLLSIVIPTKDRFEYVQHSIRCALAIKATEIEVVVRDTSTSDDLRNWFNANNRDGRLVFESTKQRESMVENFNHAVALATGKYVTVIGDDDGVTADIIEAARWADAHELDALNGACDQVYRWPDFETKYQGKRHAATLTIPAYSCSVASVDPEPELQKCAKSGGQSIGNLPKVYYGIIRREVLDKVKLKTGVYFPGISPDLAGAAASACFVKRLVVIDYPFCIPGNGRRSAAGDGARKLHIGELRDQNQLFTAYVLQWSSFVPPFYSGPTMWAESFVRAMQMMNRNDVLDCYNRALLHGICAAFSPGFIPCILRSLFYGSGGVRMSKSALFAQFVVGYMQSWKRRTSSLLMRTQPFKDLSKETTLRDINDIKSAADAMQKHLESRGLFFERILQSDLA